MRVLSIGGSGFVSGTLVREAIDQGHEVWAVSRGHKSMPQGVRAVTVDRHDADAFARAIEATGQTFDLAVDCIGYEARDAAQDVAVLRDRVGHLVFISTDFVYDPAARQFPQPEDSTAFDTAGYGAGKRACETTLLAADTGDMLWTVLRPCHIYGPGSQLGCLPEHGRDPELIDRLRRGEPLRLVGGGSFLQQPIFARDLAKTALSAAGVTQAHRRLIHVAGPDIIESRTYYRIIADVLGASLSIEEVSVQAFLQAHPERLPFCCHRIYDLTGIRETGLHLPATSIRDGLTEHVQSLLDSR